MLLVLAWGLACRATAREPWLTCFDARFGASLRYPASWTMEVGEQEQVRYRHFLSPASGPQRQPGVAVTLLASPLTGTLDDYAARYLQGQGPATVDDEQRPLARGRAWTFASSDRMLRQRLVLVEPVEAQAAPDGARLVYGLHVRVQAALYERESARVDELLRSFALERPSAWREIGDARFGFTLRVPESWPETRRFSGPERLLVQFTSPALAADRGGATVHTSLSVSVEPLPPGATLASFYESALKRQGDPVEVQTHRPWGAGFVDVARVETTLAAARQKRFYRVAGGRGYTLAFEGRDDIFQRASAWCDQIAATFTSAAPPLPQ
jgi:hypothetical protein